MRIGPETEKKAAAALQKLKDVDAADEWDKLTETDFYWAVVYCVNEYMNSKAVRNRPIVDRPWSVEEWKVEVCATTRKAFDMFLGYMPPEYQQKILNSTVSVDRISRYLGECWEGRDYYEGWIGRWKWEWLNPNSWVPPYEERKQYVSYLLDLKRKQKTAANTTEEEKMVQVREMIRAREMSKLREKSKAKVKGKAKAKGNAAATLVYSTSQHAEAAGPNEHSMDVTPDPKPHDEAPGTTVVAAEHKLSELHL